MPRRRWPPREVLPLGIAVMVGLWCVASLVPIAVTVLASVKDQPAILADPLGWPNDFRLANFAKAWRGAELGRPFWVFAVNSGLAVGTGVLVGVAGGTMAAYALARRPGRISSLISRYFVLLLVVPPVATWIPLFGLIASLGLLNNPLVIGVVYSAFVVPVAAILMRSYFAGFPLDVIEAAELDGASEVRTFWTIVVPMSLGAIGIVSVVQVVSLWNELALAVILLTRGDSQTLPVGLTQFAGQYGVDLGAQFASLVFGLMPPIVLYVRFQHRLAQGMRLGGLR